MVKKDSFTRGILGLLKTMKLLIKINNVRFCNFPHYTYHTYLNSFIITLSIILKKTLFA